MLASHRLDVAPVTASRRCRLTRTFAHVGRSDQPAQRRRLARAARLRPERARRGRQSHRPVGRLLAENHRAGAAASGAFRSTAPQGKSRPALPRPQRRDARPSAGRGLCPGARSRPSQAGHAALRRPAPGRRRDPPPLDRRDANRRRQDAHRDAAVVPRRARGQGRPPSHGERLPRTPRRRVDGADLPRPRHERRDHSKPDAAGGPPQGVRLRRHLRHGQRNGLRLPARSIAAPQPKRRTTGPVRTNVGRVGGWGSRPAGAARPVLHAGR